MFAESARLGGLNFSPPNAAVFRMNRDWGDVLSELVHRACFVGTKHSTLILFRAIIVKQRKN
jgi:hypothetical protein